MTHCQARELAQHGHPTSMPLRAWPWLTAIAALLALTPPSLAQQSAASADKSPKAAGGASLTVLELFTSQGCSSCPPADELLKVFVARPDTMALSLSVDYWDQLGWKDTLASPKHTARQHAYAKVLASGNVFTPQMIVNGMAQAVGSRRPAIEAAITKTAPGAGTRIPISAVNDGTRTTIDVGEIGRDPSAASGTIWLVRLSPRVEVEIKKGENRGRKLTYLNVVREISAVGMWSGKPMRIELPTSAVLEPGERCAILLQKGEVGRILGAAWMTP